MEITIFNEISLNGKEMHLKDMQVYYEIDQLIPCKGIFIDGPKAFNIISGNKLEDDKDLVKSKYTHDPWNPYLIVLDIKGLLNGYLHNFRQKQEIREIIVLVKNNSPQEYLKYLKDRDYTYVNIEQFNNLIEIFEYLEKEFNIDKIRFEGSIRYHKELFDYKGTKDFYLLIDSMVTRGKVDGFNMGNYPEFELVEVKILHHNSLLTHYKVH